MKLSIIIPVYNELKTVEKILRKTDAVKFKIEKEIIVVDDGSTDGSGELLEQLYQQKSIKSFAKLFRLPTNLGKASALRIGIAISTGDIIVSQDADDELDSNDLPKLLEPLLTGETEVVFGSRFINGFPPNMQFPYIFINKFLSFLIRILYFRKITDEATAFKMFFRKILNNISITSAKFEYCPELTAKFLNRNYKIVEVPISYNPRKNTADKKIKWFDGIEAIYTLIKFRFLELS